jgi:hypothetical protein
LFPILPRPIRSHPQRLSCSQSEVAFKDCLAANQTSPSKTVVQPIRSHPQRLSCSQSEVTLKDCRAANQKSPSKTVVQPIRSHPQRLSCSQSEVTLKDCRAANQKSPSNTVLQPIRSRLQRLSCTRPRQGRQGVKGVNNTQETLSHTTGNLVPYYRKLCPTCTTRKCKSIPQETLGHIARLCEIGRRTGEVINDVSCFYDLSVSSIWWIRGSSITSKPTKTTSQNNRFAKKRHL